MCIRDREVTGPHSYEAVMAQVHKYVPKPEHNPYISLVPKQGVKLDVYKRQQIIFLDNR